MILESMAAIAFDRSLLKERITFTRMDDNHFDLLFCFRDSDGFYYMSIVVVIFIDVHKLIYSIVRSSRERMEGNFFVFRENSTGVSYIA